MATIGETPLSDVSSSPLDPRVAAVALLLIPVLTFCGAIVQMFLSGRRRRAFRQFASAHQFTCSQGLPPGAPNLEEVYTSALPVRGRAGVLSVAIGEWRHQPAVIADVVMTNGYARDRKITGHFTTVAIRTPHLWPAIHLQPETVASRLTPTRDYDLEWTAFNDAFRLVTSDAAMAATVLHPRAMEAVMAGPRWSWAFTSSGYVVVFVSGDAPIADIERALAMVTAVVALLPPWLLRSGG